MRSPGAAARGGAHAVGRQRSRRDARGSAVQGARHRDVSLWRPPRRRHRHAGVHLLHHQLEHAAHRRAAGHRLAHPAGQAPLRDGRHDQRAAGPQLRRAHALAAEVQRDASGRSLFVQRGVLGRPPRHHRRGGPEDHPPARPADGEASGHPAALDRGGAHRPLAGWRHQPPPAGAGRQEPRPAHHSGARDAGDVQAAHHGRHHPVERQQQLARGGGRRHAACVVLPGGDLHGPRPPPLHHLEATGLRVGEDCGDHRVPRYARAGAPLRRRDCERVCLALPHHSGEVLHGRTVGASPPAMQIRKEPAAVGVLGGDGGGRQGAAHRGGGVCGD
mmetsp:Transcript_43278/g.99164  ORF Transcript_43278/g.99164 Transcript_43278/m.99164 type:complete len:331 (+) Transcript_43278:531-1523(+)